MADSTPPALGVSFNFTNLTTSEVVSLTGLVGGVVPFFPDTAAQSPQPLTGDRPLPANIKQNTTPATIATPIKTNIAASLTSQQAYAQNAQRIKAILWNDPAGTAGGEAIISFGGTASPTTASFPLFPGQIWEVAPEDAGMSLHTIWRTTALGVLRITETV